MDVLSKYSQIMYLRQKLDHVIQELYILQKLSFKI